MIMPTKHITPRESLLGLGARLLPLLKNPQTVPALWHAAKGSADVGTFERFVLAMDLLYLMGAVEFRSGLLRRVAE
jgi:hypothetical protein